jgi:hypothetical protein
MKRIIRIFLKRMGLKLVPIQATDPFGPDMEEDFKSIYWKTKPFTMTSLERMYAVYKATRHIAKLDIPGSIVECGVWKGGSAMVAALTLLSLGKTDRDIYLYDTYEGMSEPSEKDIHHTGSSAKTEWDSARKSDRNEWCYSPVNEVKANMLSTGYPKERLHFIQGKVEDTIPGVIPDRIAILRLDTDWYESTYHELKHLYPVVSEGGFLIIDDYGCWQGAREAVDRFFSNDAQPLFLDRIDYTGRIGVKNH